MKTPVQSPKKMSVEAISFTPKCPHKNENLVRSPGGDQSHEVESDDTNPAKPQFFSTPPLKFS